MKTLKQLLEEEGYTLTGSIRCAARRWLEQKRQVRTATNTYANIGYQQAITELLGELKQ